MADAEARAKARKERQDLMEKEMAELEKQRLEREEKRAKRKIEREKREQEIEQMKLERDTRKAEREKSLTDLRMSLSDKSVKLEDEKKIEKSEPITEESDEKAKQEEEKKAKEEAAKKAKEEADKKAAEEEKKAKEEADKKAEEEKKAKEEADKKAEEEKKAKEEANKKVKEEADKKAKEEADKKAKEEADMKAKEEADKKAKEEADKKATEEAEKKAEEEKKAKEEAEKKAEEEKKAKEEADKKVKEEADKKAKEEEAEKKAKEEAEKKAKEEAEKKAKEEAEKKAKEEAEKKAKEEAEKKAKEEAEKKAKEEADKKTKEEADKKAKEEAENKAKEEADKKAKEEADKKAEEEKKAKEEADKKAAEEEKKAKEEADKKAAEEEKKAKEEADKKAAEEEKKAKEEEDKKAVEEEKKAKEEADKKAEEEKKATEEAVKKVEEDKEKKEETEEAPAKAAVNRSESTVRRSASGGSFYIAPKKKDIVTGTDGSEFGLDWDVQLQEKLIGATKRRVKGPSRNRKAKGNVVRTLQEREKKGDVVAAEVSESESRSGTDDEIVPLKHLKSIGSQGTLGSDSCPDLTGQRVRPRSITMQSPASRPGSRKNSGAGPQSDLQAQLAGLLSKGGGPGVNRLGQDPNTANAKDILGAIKQGFTLKSKKSATKYDPKLLKMKGNKKIRVCEVEISAKSLNHNDCFVYDDGNGKIYLYKGKNARILVCNHGTNLAQRMKDKDYAGRGVVTVINNDEDAKVGRDEAAFWTALKGERNDIPNDEGISNEDYEKQYLSNTKLYGKKEDDDANGFEVIAEKAFTKTMLNDSKSYVLQCFDCIYIWNGRHGNSVIREQCIQFAEELYKQKERPAWATIKTIVDRGEPSFFKDMFAKWSDDGMSLGVKQQGNIQRKSKTPYITGADVIGKNKEVDIKKMLNEKINDTPLIDDATGKVEVWHCTEKLNTELKQEEFGNFYACDSYVVLYSRSDKKDIYIMYVWQGAEARANDNGAAAVLAGQLNQQYGAKQIRVCQSKEPPHFLAIFDKLNGMITHKGSRGQPVDDTRMYKIHGVNPTVRASYITVSCANLSSNSVFIITDGKKKYIWKGAGSRGEELENAKKNSKMINALADTEVSEGSEPSAMFSLFAEGKKQAYAHDAYLKEIPYSAYIRMWKIDLTAGEPRAHEVQYPTQHDLESDSAYIVDCFYTIYVWVGSTCSQDVFKLVLATTASFEKQAMEHDPKRVKFKNVGTIVYSGEESNTFKGNFITWDIIRAAKMSKEQSSTPNTRRRTGSISVKESLGKLNTKSKYTLAELTVEVQDLPPDVDAAKKEEFLNENEFIDLFKMTSAEYFALPKWKQQQKKKATVLF